MISNYALSSAEKSGNSNLYFLDSLRPDLYYYYDFGK